MKNATNQQVNEMPGQVVGYYSSRKGKLLKDFNRTLSLIRGWLVARYGEEFASALQREARQEFEKLLPEIPYIKALRAGPLNIFLLATAQELAAYKTMANHGKSPAETWELCHQAIRLRVVKIPRWKRWLLRRLMFSSLVKAIMARRARQKQRGHFGDFEIEYLIGEGENFDFGVNYLQCGNHRFAMKHGGEAFAPYICMSDIALSDALGWGLKRTQTIADGCHHCDFRFKQGAATQISSKTPEVQDVIERISEKEAKQRQKGG